MDQSTTKTKPTKTSSEANADSNTSESKSRSGKLPKKVASSGLGLNWMAIGFLVLMILPAIMTGSMHVWDYFYPEEAQARGFAARLRRCYDAAGQQDKLASVDETIKKYQGKEHILFSKIRAKYEKYPECH